MRVLKSINQQYRIPKCFEYWHYSRVSNPRILGSTRTGSGVSGTRSIPQHMIPKNCRCSKCLQCLFLEILCFSPVYCVNARSARICEIFSEQQRRCIIAIETFTRMHALRTVDLTVTWYSYLLHHVICL